MFCKQASCALDAFPSNLAFCSCSRNGQVGGKPTPKFERNAILSCIVPSVCWPFSNLSACAIFFLEQLRIPWPQMIESYESLNFKFSYGFRNIYWRKWSLFLFKIKKNAKKFLIILLGPITGAYMRFMATTGDRDFTKVRTIPKAHSFPWVTPPYISTVTLKIPGPPLRPREPPLKTAD